MPLVAQIGPARPRRAPLVLDASPRPKIPRAERFEPCSEGTCAYCPRPAAFYDRWRGRRACARCTVDVVTDAVKSSPRGDLSSWGVQR